MSQFSASPGVSAFTLAGFPAPIISGLRPQNFTGTLSVPKINGMELQIWKDGIRCSSVLTAYPRPNQISSGFSALQHDAGRSHAVSIVSSQIQQFASMEEKVTTSGDVISTSHNVRIVSFGRRDFGYFDLISACDRGFHSNYSSKDTASFNHSGDHTYMNNLIHTVSMKSTVERGIFGLVGYQSKQLYRWYGTSPGLYVLDLESNVAFFVPLDLAQLTVRDNYMTVPLWFEKKDGGFRFYVPKPEELVVGKSDTGDSYRSAAVTELLRSMRIPNETRQQVALGGASVAPIAASISTASSDSDEVFPPHNCSPVVISTSACIEKVVPNFSGEKLFVGRAVTRVSPQIDEPLFPLLFPNDTISCREALLRLHGISPAELEHLLSNRNIVVVVCGKKGLDPVFLKSRSFPRTRIHGVFVIQVDTPADFVKTDMSFISDTAGHRSTIVFQTRDGKYYFCWGTPESIIPRGIVPQELKCEWPEFPALLSEYMASPPEHRLVEIGENSEQTPISVGNYDDISFSTLPEFLELIQQQDLSVVQQQNIIQCLFQFEFLLDEKKITELKKLIKSNFKVKVSPLDKQQILEQISQAGRASKETIATIRQSRNEGKDALKANDRIAEIFTSRLSTTINTFEAKFQESMAANGGKAQDRLLKNREFRKFVTEASTSDLFAELGEIEEYLVMQIDPNAFQRFFLNKIPVPHSLAIMNPRTSLLDAVTLEAIGSLEIQHGMSCREGLQIAYPISQRWDIASFLALPIFKKKRVDFNDFHVGIWPHILKYGVGNLVMIPRDHKFKPRELEFKLIEVLLFILEQLCAKRSSPVDPNSADVEDVLVRQIRSVWWLVYSVMNMNVGLLTPEPLSVVMFSNDIKDAEEIYFALRMIETFPKTGLNPEYLKVRVPLTEVLVRGLFRPFEARIIALARSKKALELEQASAQRAKMRYANSSFYKDAYETDSYSVKANLRPKYCSGCDQFLSVHDFPRSSRHVLVVAGQIQSVDFNTSICFACQGHEEPELICPRERCSLAGKPQSRFQISSGHNQGKYWHPNCYTCMEEGIVIASRKRMVPPRYFKYFGISEAPSSKKSSDGVAVSTIDTRLDVSSIWNEGEIVGLEQIDTIVLGTPISTEEFIQLAKRFGLLSNTIEMRVTLRELSNIVCMMINNCSEIPAWKSAIPLIMDGRHKDPNLQITPNSAVFKVPQPGNAIEAPEPSEQMVESGRKNCVIM